MTEKTSAWYEFYRRMKNAWPWPGPPRLEMIDGMLNIDGLMHLALKHPGLGKLVGEPGDSQPYAECKCFPDGSNFILISGGLLDFVEAVIAVTVAGAKLQLTKGAVIDPINTPDEVDDVLLVLYTNWQNLKGNETRLVVTKPDWGETAQNHFDTLYLATRAFILLHEYGHAALHPTIQEKDRRPEHELEADAFALDTMLRFKRPGMNYLTLIAGSTLVPRIYKALEIMGHTFKKTHPPPQTRIAALFDRVRSVAATEFDYYGLTGQSRVIDLRLSAAERKFVGADNNSDRFSGEDIIFSVTSGAHSIAGEPPTNTFEGVREIVMSYLVASNVAARQDVAALWKRVKSSVYRKTEIDNLSLFEKCMDIAHQVIQSLPEDDRMLFGID